MIALALVALLAADPFQARAFPRVSLPGADLTFTFESVGPLTEATYCVGIEVTWPDGTHSRDVPDCPPWEEYQRQQRVAAECEDLVIVCPPGFDCFLPECRAPRYVLQRRWTFSTRRQRVYFGPGDWAVLVRFLLPNNRHQDRVAQVFVGGGE